MIELVNKKSNLHFTKDIIIDKELSNKSTNPVQNKVITKKIEEIEKELEYDQFSQFVTPQKYGAIADGCTDDTVAIQNAINSGEEIFIPKGNYKITSSIILHSNCKICGTIGSNIIGSPSISGLIVEQSANNIRIENLAISGCNYALDVRGYNCIFNDLLLSHSNSGCFIHNSAYANYFNECSFKYNDIGIEGRIIYTSNFKNCQIYHNKSYGIKSNFRIVSIDGGYIEENGVDKVNGTLIPQLGKAGIYIPNDETYGSAQLTFNSVDFENNGEAAILVENQGRVIDVTFIGGQISVINHENTKAAIWFNVFDRVQRWLFYGTKFPESDDLVKKQIAGHPEGNWNVLGKKPTQIYTNRRFNSDNANIIQHATIDGTTTNSFFVSDAERETWNNKSDFSGSYNDLTDKPTIPTVPTNVSEFTNDAGYISDIQPAVNEALAQAKASGEFNGEDGYTPVKGVDYFDGDKGEKGDKGETGKQGEKGLDGVSITHSWNDTTLYITSASGTSSANLKGEKGDRGIDGYTPIKGVDYFDGAKGDKGDKGDTGSTGKDGYTPIKGKDYFDGANGKDGYTPVKGTDYWTTADKNEMVSAVLSALPTWNGGSY